MSQKTRYLKAFKEKIFILDIKINEMDIIFKISGVTRNVYTLKINKKTIMCDCPDATMRGKTYICKHGCFILSKVLRFVTLDANKLKNNTEHDTQINSQFYEKHEFDDDEYDKILLLTKNLKIVEHTDIELLEKYNKNYKKLLDKMIKDDNTCPICFDDFDTNACLVTNIFRCNICNNSTHIECIIKWGKDSCIYCKNNITIEKDKYVKL